MNLIYIFNDGATDDIVEATITAVRMKVACTITPTTSLIDPDDGFENRRMMITMSDDPKTDFNTILNLGGFIGSIEENVTTAFRNAERLTILTEN